jgi:branched-chain amino acid transport system substrate-binding protein
MKIGILLPRSITYPSIAMDFMNGLKENTKNNTTISFLTENIGNGGVEKEVFEKAESLLMMQDVDILVAFIDFKILPLIEPLLLASDKLMIVVNAGANYPQNWAPQANIIHLNLQIGFMCWLTGKLAAQNGDKNAIFNSTFYDCGYMQVVALTNAFTKNNGAIQYNHINNSLYDDSFAIDDVASYVQSNDTKKMLCIMDVKPAQLFYNKLTALKNAADLELFVSPLMLAKNTANPFTVCGYTTWMENLPAEHNEKFKAQFKQGHTKSPTIFTVLGWEVGTICNEIYDHSPKLLNGAEKTIAQLASVQLDSPRGKMILDTNTNFYMVDAYQCTYAANSNEAVFALATNQKEEWQLFTNDVISGVMSGWTNTYLCY